MLTQESVERNTQNGPVAIDINEWLIYVDGRQCGGVYYGTAKDAWMEYRDWRDDIERCPNILDHLKTPIDELPDRYWKNGHIAPLTLDADEIPFDGQPVGGDDGYGLQVAI